MLSNKEMDWIKVPGHLAIIFHLLALVKCLVRVAVLIIL